MICKKVSLNCPSTPRHKSYRVSDVTPRPTMIQYLLLYISDEEQFEFQCPECHQEVIPAQFSISILLVCSCYDYLRVFFSSYSNYRLQWLWFSVSAAQLSICCRIIYAQDKPSPNRLLQIMAKPMVSLDLTFSFRIH